MALDLTIAHAAGEPLGSLESVREELSCVFPGIIHGELPGGAEKLREAAAQGIMFPESIRAQWESIPPRFVAEYDGASFSVQLNLGSSAQIDRIHGVLRGVTTAVEPLFSDLERRTGWIVSHP
jgi:hypothetical protein